MDEDWVNRRKQTRFRVKDCLVRSTRNGLLSFLRRPEGEPNPMLNLSTGGLEFMSSECYAQGQELRVEMDIPAFDTVLKARAEVRWHVAVPDQDLYRIGAEFSSIDDETVALIAQLERDGLMRNLERERAVLL